MLKKLCTQTAKTTPYFTHSGCLPGLYPDESSIVTAFIRSVTLTNFHRRAVMGKPLTT
jgi:hypothetical protein